jgi:hypothetical protein
MTMHWLESVASETAKMYLATQEREVDHISALGRMYDRPGALLHMEDLTEPTCPACEEVIRSSDSGRFIYYRRRIDPSPLPTTRFCHERCLRRLSYERPQVVTVSDVLAVSEDRMGSVF